MAKPRMDYCRNCYEEENIASTRMSELGRSFLKYRCMECGETWIDHDP